MVPDPAADAPLWRQVLDDLEARLERGEFDERFPTDRELVERYEVSRHTVREAVRHLKARGVIARERGRGSQVVRPEILQPFGTLYSLFRAVESQGVRQANEVLALDEQVEPRAAASLELPDDAALVRLERLRYAGGEPLALDTVWLPPDVGRPLLDVDFRHVALYDVMEQRLGFRPDAGTEELVAMVGDEELRDALQLAPDEAVLRIRRTGRHAGRPVECRLTLIRGSRFGLLSSWPATDRTVAPVLDPA